MRPGLHHKLINGNFEDPCLYVKIPWEKRALLFDAGDLRRLSTPEIHKISDIFVTHTHIDHFIGFDAVLRTVLRRDSALNVYGPPKIASCVEGKLRGYTWNLIREYPTVINVYSFDGRRVVHSVFRARNGFKREPVSKAESDGLIMTDALFRVVASRMDHDIPCLAYRLEEEEHININKDGLNRIGLPVGPWLRTFKTALRSGFPGDESIDVAGTQYRMRDLAGIASITAGQKICYATDIAMNRRNAARLIRLAKDSDVFYCEAFFLEEDSDLASKRFHLTAKASGTIAARAGAARFVPMHFSPRYMDFPERVSEEAMREFERTSSASEKRQAAKTVKA